MSTQSTQDGHAMGMRNARSVAVEFVTDGHPDKICDQIGDSILDAALAQDPLSRVAMETTGGHGLVVVIGEMSTEGLDIVRIVQEKYRAIGHDSKSLEVLLRITKQSPHIKQGVDIEGAGDQGIMTGYAIRGEANFMPRGWNIARALTQRLKEVREKRILDFLKPDGKSQVTMEDGVVTRVTIAAHHSEEIGLEQLRADIITHVIRHVLPDFAVVLLVDPKNPPPGANTVINGTGKFAQGGFDADAGTTGRKMMVDNYGPGVEVGGGAYSGKDPSKVDRSAAYFARLVAKSIVASGRADEAIVKVGYAIGIEEPTFFSVETLLPEEAARKLETDIREKFDFRPKAIIEKLGLRTPQGWCYADTAAAGHYGDNRFPWEQVVEI